MSTAADIQQIKRRLQKMRPSEINTVKEFVEFVARKDCPNPSTRNIVRLKGIWKGKGFERLDLEKEIKEVRRELGEQIEKRARKWNT
jgi:hypothetical protein